MVLVCLPDSVLAFHKHGMQGRSFKNGEVTQEISDPSRTYRLLGSDKYVFLYMYLNNFKILKNKMFISYNLQIYKYKN